MPFATPPDPGVKIAEFNQLLSATASSTPTPTPTSSQSPPSFIAPVQITSYKLNFAQTASVATSRVASGRSAEANAWATAGNKSDYQANAVDDFVKTLQQANVYDLFTDIWIENVPLKTARTWTDAGNRWTTPMATPVGADVASYNYLPYDGDVYSYSNGTLYFGYNSAIGAYGKNGTQVKPAFELNGGSGWRRVIRQGGVGAELSTTVAYADLLLQTADSAKDAETATKGLARVVNNQLMTLYKAQILCFAPNGEYYFPLTGYSVKNKIWAIAARKLSAALLGRVAEAIGSAGDSITAGFWPYGSGCFIGQLETKTGIAHINGGRGGNSFRPNNAQPGSRADYVDNLRPWVQAGIVKKVLIAYGANDVNFASSIAAQFNDPGGANGQAFLDRTVNELGLLVNDILADGLTKPDILVSGLLTKGLESNRYPMDTAIEAWCTANNVNYVQNWRIMNAKPQAFIDSLYYNNAVAPSDDIHPKDAVAGAYIADSILGINPVPAALAPTYTSISPSVINPGTTVTVTGTNISPSSPPTWTGGNQPNFVYTSATQLTFVAPAVGSYTVGGVAFTVTAAQTVYGLFDTLPAPTTTSAATVTTGLRAQVKLAGYITKLVYWRPTGSTNNNLPIKLWSDTGTELASAFVTGLATGRNEITLATPVQVAANQIVRVAVSGNDTRYQSSTVLDSNAGLAVIGGVANYANGTSFPDQVNDQFFGLGLVLDTAYVPPTPIFTATAYSPTTRSVGDIVTVTHTGTRPTNLSLSIAFGSFNPIVATAISATQFTIVVPSTSPGVFKSFRFSGDGGATSTSPADGTSITIV